MCPNSVRMPVATTTASPSPAAIDGAREQHVALLGARVMRGLQVGAGIAATRDRFARQCGVVDPHVERLDQAAVGGHLIAFGQRDHIARNQGGDRQIAGDPITPDAHRGGQQSLKRFECLRAPVAPARTRTGR